jgi:hypothetical protein
MTTTEEVPETSDRKLCPDRVPNSDAARAIVADVLRQIDAFEFPSGPSRQHRRPLRQRRRRPTDQASFERTVSAVLCDVMYHAAAGLDGGVAVSLSKQVLGRRSRYRPAIYGDTFPTILRRLASPEMGFLKMTVGYSGMGVVTGRRTVIEAGPRLLSRMADAGIAADDFRRSESEEVIILKRTKEDRRDTGRPQEYEDTETTRRYRAEVKEINAWLAEADVSFDPVATVDGRAVDVDDRRLRRIFCRGSFEFGGRLFGGFWQQLKRVERREGVIIQGQSPVTLDYGQMGPRILYGIAKAKPPAEDMYMIPGLEEYRAGVKTLFNALMFSPRPLARMPKNCRDLFPRWISVGEVVRRISEAHRGVRHLFLSGIGFTVQFHESTILIDVLLRLKRLGIVALPVHDAVIVPRSASELAEHVMLEAFYFHTRVHGRVSEER